MNVQVTEMTDPKLTSGIIKRNIILKGTMLTIRMTNRWQDFPLLQNLT